MKKNWVINIEKLPKCLGGESYLCCGGEDLD